MASFFIVSNLVFLILHTVSGQGECPKVIDDPVSGLSGYKVEPGFFNLLNAFSACNVCGLDIQKPATDQDFQDLSNLALKLFEVENEAELPVVLIGIQSTQFGYLYASTLGFVPDSLFDSVNVINSGGRCGTYNFATKTIEMISCDGTEAAIICITRPDEEPVFPGPKCDLAFIETKTGVERALISQLMTHSDASVQCRICDSVLASPENDNEAQALYEFIKSQVKLSQGEEILQSGIHAGYILTADQTNVLQLTEAGPQPVDTDNIGLNFDLDATGICGGLSFLGSEITFAQCDGPDNLRSYICEAAVDEVDKEDDIVYVGAQLEFCLLTVQVCKEVIPLCDNPGIIDTYCCRSKAFYWPLFKTST